MLSLLSYKRVSYPFNRTTDATTVFSRSSATCSSVSVIGIGLNIGLKAANP